MTCGSGTKTKLRNKILTTARNGGRDCAGPSQSSTTCTGYAAVPNQDQCRSNSQTKERLVVGGRLGDFFIDKGVSRFKKIWN